MHEAWHRNCIWNLRCNPLTAYANRTIKNWVKGFYGSSNRDMGGMENGLTFYHNTSWQLSKIFSSCYHSLSHPNSKNN